MFLGKGFLTLLLTCLIIGSGARGICQAPGELFLRLKALGNTHTVLYVAAHPDDENTRLLTWLARARGVRTAYVSLTRGEGGQNLIGPEQGRLLGILRTQELLAARRVDGAEQYFTTARDFGYSKKPEETLRLWSRDSVLWDLVWIIRQLQPDVIMCRFPTTGEGGHGHHTASAILAEEAAEWAAHPAVFPEQLRWVQPWRCPRLLWNTFRFGQINTIDSSQYRQEVGTFIPLLGASVGELAAESRSCHRSQGFGTEKKRQPVEEYFKTLKGTAPSTDLLDHVPGGWSRYPGWAFVDSALNGLLKQFDLQNPSALAPGLLNLRAAILAKAQRSASEPLPAILHHRLRQLEDLVLDVCGIFVEATSPTPRRLVNSPYTIQFMVVNRSPVPVVLREVTGWGFSKFYSASLEFGQPFRDTLRGVSQWQEVISMPYDYVEHEPLRVYLPQEAAENQNLEKLLEGAEMEAYAPVVHWPEYRPEIQCRVVFEILGHRLVRECQILYKNVDPVRGECYEPLVVGPPVILFSEKPFYYFFAGKTTRIGFKLRNDGPSAQVRLMPGVEAPLQARPSQWDGHLKAGADTSIFFDIYVPESWAPHTCRIRPEVKIRESTYRLTEHRIEYDHIPRQVVFAPLDIQACVLESQARLARLRCLYVKGSGDYGDEALRQLGFDVTLWQEGENFPGPLTPENYPLVVCGVRVLNVRKDLEALRQALPSYVQAGGRLVMQYNTLQDVADLAPWIPQSLRISRQRITDETAPVQLLDSQHPIWHCPLKIKEYDFRNWIQEKALYVPDSWDASWTPLLASSDPGEPNLKGLLLEAQWGRGRVYYTTLSFFRQLPAAVPGAVRLFLNICFPGRCQPQARKNHSKPSSAKEK